MLILAADFGNAEADTDAGIRVSINHGQVNAAHRIANTLERMWPEDDNAIEQIANAFRTNGDNY
jgi:hypothetical protein